MLTKVVRPEPRQIHRPALFPILAVFLGLFAPAGPVRAQGWPGYGHDPQHSCQAVGGSVIPGAIRWSTPVDLAPPNNGVGDLYIHYGSPIITRLNTVLVPVKTTAAGGFQIKAINPAGQVVWASPVSDYTLPSYGWVPIFGATLTPKDRYLVYPGAGGTIYARTFPDTATGTTSQFAFYNTTTNFYAMNPAAFNSAIQICTPISSDALGNLFFGFVSNGAPLPGYPNGIPGGGLARVSSTGVGSFVTAANMTGDASIVKVAYNCSPSFSADGSTVYVAANNSNGRGYLCALNTTTLATKSVALLFDPSSPTNTAFVDDDGSATPTVGPDGDVYYGVLAYNISNNHYRGYLLHFNNTLTVSKTPSAFGWDDTASIVPSKLVKSYKGTSSYLLLTKYNNYGEGGGNGINQLAIVDPNATMTDPISGVTVMKTILTVNGITPDSNFPNLPGAVREWCINSAAIDPINNCAVVNSEDGHVYRWSFDTNSLSAGLNLQPPTGEAYTPTVIGPDGAIYAINNAQLFCCIAGNAPNGIKNLSSREAPMMPSIKPILRFEQQDSISILMMILHNPFHEWSGLPCRSPGRKPESSDFSSLVCWAQTLTPWVISISPAASVRTAMSGL